MRTVLGVSLLLAACGGLDNGGGTTQCDGTLTLSTDVGFANKTFAMCNSSFISGEATFDTGEDSQPEPKTAITLTAVGVSTNSTLPCDGSGADDVTVNDSTIKDFNGSDVPYLSTDCTIKTTTYDSSHWSGTVSGTLKDTICTTSSSCAMESHPFTMSFVLQP